MLNEICRKMLWHGQRIFYTRTKKKLNCVLNDYTGILFRQSIKKNGKYPFKANMVIIPINLYNSVSFRNSHKILP